MTSDSLCAVEPPLIGLSVIENANENEANENENKQVL